jgi:hypothetical protein
VTRNAPSCATPTTRRVDLNRARCVGARLGVEEPDDSPRFGFWSTVVVKTAFDDAPVTTTATLRVALLRELEAL